MKQILIVGGGTIYPIKNHLALTAPAYGSTALRLTKLCRDFFPTMEIQTVLTKMADPDSKIETYAHLKDFTEKCAQRRNLKIVFFNPAVVDFVPTVESARHLTRLDSTTPYNLYLTPLPKLINTFRSEKKAGRKDIFVIGFKQTHGLTQAAQYKSGLNMLKKNQVNLVLANDMDTKANMIITPEEASYHVTYNRSEALYNLIEMTKLMEKRKVSDPLIQYPKKGGL